MKQSFHDRVALKALEDGGTSGQFRKAAQDHAKACWFCLILAGIVWYFAGWAWALLPLALAVFVALQSISSTFTAQRLEAFEKLEKS